METDVALVSAMMLVVLALPALISAWADKRLPYVGTLLLFCGCGLGVWAYRTNPGGYTPEQLPDVVYTVIGDLFF